jgi:hypothetical protein
MLYFSYGSNMDPSQIRRRCPSARFVTVALLPDHALTFPIRSPRRRCAAAGIVPAKGKSVWGVVFRITASRDITALDQAEGYRFPGSRKNRYRRVSCIVYADQIPSKPVQVYTYLARSDRYTPLPCLDYLNQMRRGAADWGLPDFYREFLRNIRPQ